VRKFLLVYSTCLSIPSSFYSTLWLHMIFLESGSMVSTIKTRLPLVDSTTTVACHPASVVPLGFEPLVAHLLAPAVPLGFLPHAALMMPVVPHMAQASLAVPRTATLIPATPRVALESPAAPRVTATPPTATDGPPPHEWSSSLIVYTKRPRRPAPSAPMAPTSTMLVR
jgi:hypothetical protein